MAFEDPPIPRFRVLYEGTLIGVHDYRCTARRSGPGPEEESGIHSIVMLRRGAFSRHRGRSVATADVNQVAFFSGADTYRVSHPADCGDCGTVLVPSPALLAELGAHAGISDDPHAPFPFTTGPATAELFRRHDHLARYLAAERADPLETEVLAIGLAGDALRRAGGASAGTPRRERTRRGHAASAEAMKAFLAGHQGQRITLDQVARAAHVSPFHGARLFREHTGVPLHRYLTLLRLRSGMDALREGGEDLSALALRLGFSSHGHFTDAFRREFGSPPSALRGSSRILEAVGTSAGR